MGVRLENANCKLPLEKRALFALTLHRAELRRSERGASQSKSAHAACTSTAEEFPRTR